MIKNSIKIKEKTPVFIDLLTNAIEYAIMIMKIDKINEKEAIQMEFYQYLFDEYGKNEPILFGEIKYKDYSEAWLYKALNRLCDEGKIVRFEKGVYYIPTVTALGTSTLNPRKVIEKKYIGTRGEKIGYYSGITFLNQLGISTQMSNTIEIFTNRETSTVREIQVGKQRVLLRRARTEITSDNVDVQSFLEMMNSVSASYFDEDRRIKVEKFISDKGITRKAIAKYAPAFPDKAMRTMVESEVIYSVTR